MEQTLFEVRDQLSRSGVVNSDLAIPLFDSLLRVALAQVSSCPDTPEEKTERVSPDLVEMHIFILSILQGYNTIISIRSQKAKRMMSKRRELERGERAQNLRHE